MLKLKELRLEAELSQKQLAEKLGTTQRNISNWEAGKNEPDIKTLVEIAKIFEVSTDYLLDFDHDPNNSTPHFSDETLLNVIKKLPQNKKIALFMFLQDF